MFRTLKYRAYRAWSGVTRHPSSLMRTFFAVLMLALPVATTLSSCSNQQGAATKVTAPVTDGQAEVLHEEQMKGLAENEAIKNKLEPYIEVRDGRFLILPGASMVVDHAVVEAVRTHLSELNALAQKGEIWIQADREIKPLRSQAPAQSLGCWRGVQTHWWGWYIGMTDADIHNILNAWNDYNRMKTVLGWLGVSIPWQINLYFNVLKYNLKVFDSYICRHSCETVTIYYWAVVTPFLNCQ